MDEIEWDNVLHKHEGWCWMPSEKALRCPSKARLPFMRIETVKGCGIRARFQAAWGVCDACELRAGCIQSADPHYRKDVRLRISKPLAETLRDLWVLSQARDDSDTARRHRATAPGSQRRAIWRLKPLSWQPPQLPPHRPALAVMPPMLLPAELRKAIQKVIRVMEIHVRVGLPKNRNKPSPVMAVSVADRQRRRLTWEQRLRWNELPDDASVEVQLLAPAAVREMIAQATVDGEQQAA